MCDRIWNTSLFTTCIVDCAIKRLYLILRRKRWDPWGINKFNLNVLWYILWSIFLFVPFPVLILLSQSFHVFEETRKKCGSDGNWFPVNYTWDWTEMWYNESLSTEYGIELETSICLFEWKRGIEIYLLTPDCLHVLSLDSLYL